VLIVIAEHVRDDPPGFTYYPSVRVRFKTQLAEYPRPLTDIEKGRIAGYESWFYRREGLATPPTQNGLDHRGQPTALTENTDGRGVNPGNGQRTSSSASLDKKMLLYYKFNVERMCNGIVCEIYV
jgi:hypothetical protein